MSIPVRADTAAKPVKAAIIAVAAHSPTGGNHQTGTSNRTPTIASAAINAQAPHRDHAHRQPHGRQQVRPRPQLDGVGGVRRGGAWALIADEDDKDPGQTKLNGQQEIGHTDPRTVVGSRSSAARL